MSWRKVICTIKLKQMNSFPFPYCKQEEQGKENPSG